MATTDESVTDESTESVETAEVNQSETEIDAEAIDATEKPDLVKDLVEQRKSLRAEKADLKKRIEAYEAAAALKDLPAAEQAIEAARAEARTEATTKANARIVRAEVKAAATGKVKNPALALKLIDTSEIDVDDDGEVDSDAVNQAITDLLEQYPELAADGSKFTGTADQGAKGKNSKPAQLTRTDVERMKAAGDNAGIVAAQAAGQLNDLLGIK